MQFIEFDWDRLNLILDPGLVTNFQNLATSLGIRRGHFHFITAHIQRRGEGNFFSLCVSPHWGDGVTPSTDGGGGGGGGYHQPPSGPDDGGYPHPSQWGNTPPPRVGRQSSYAAGGMLSFTQEDFLVCSDIEINPLK